MRRAVAISALAALLAGCSIQDTSLVDKFDKPVKQHVVIKVAMENSRDFFDLDVEWGYGDESHKERVAGNTAVERRVTMTWPDQAIVYATGTPSKKPGVDDLLAYAQGEPVVRCSITINGRVVSEENLTMCRADLTWDPVPDPSGTAG